MRSIALYFYDTIIFKSIDRFDNKQNLRIMYNINI